MPPTLKYEPGVIVADGDLVIVHGRFSGFGAPVNWIAADILRIEDGVLVEHWDVIQDEATQEQSKSGRPMFGDSFPEAHVSTGPQRTKREATNMSDSSMMRAVLRESFTGYTGLKLVEVPRPRSWRVLSDRCNNSTSRRS